MTGTRPYRRSLRNARAQYHKKTSRLCRRMVDVARMVSERHLTPVVAMAQAER